MYYRVNIICKRKYIIKGQREIRIDKLIYTIRNQKVVWEEVGVIGK